MSGVEREVVVTGCGVIAAAGDSPEALYRSLMAGAPRPRPAGELAEHGLPALPTAPAQEFDARRYLGRKGLRALDRTAKLAASAAALALGASGIDRDADEREVGLVLGTMFGSIATIAGFDLRALEAGPSYASPMQFANSVINAAAGQTAIRHSLTGVNATVSGGAVSGLQAIAYAADQIRAGRAGVILAGGADELCLPSLIGLFRQGHLWDGSGPAARPVPFDARRNGMAVGEGAALLTLESRACAVERGATVLAEIVGFGTGYDRTRGERPEEATTRAVRAALEDAGMTPRKVAAVSASANGGVRRDRGEALALDALFGEDGARSPVTASKSVLGETLGAAGGLATVGLIESMRRGELPGIAGFESSADGLPALDLAAGGRPVGSGYGLVNGVGLDGKAAALVIRVPEPGEREAA